MPGYIPSMQTPPPRQTPPAQCMLGYGQQAGVAHLTGMHSVYEVYVKVCMLESIQAVTGQPYLDGGHNI